MFRKFLNWNPKPMTHEERVNSAAALQGYALDVFRKAQTELDQAAVEFDQAADTILGEITDLGVLAGTARTSGYEARTQAIRLKELFG